MKAFLLVCGLSAVLGSFEATAGHPPSPDNHWWCQAIGYRGTVAMAVVSQNRWDQGEAEDAAMYECRDVQQLEGCYIESCWVQEPS